MMEASLRNAKETDAPLSPTEISTLESALRAEGEQR